jgi:hypothetical protein
MERGDGERLDASEREQEDRRRAMAVMAGSVAPGSAGWLFPRSRNRRAAYCAGAALLVFVGFDVWAGASGHVALIAYACGIALGLAGVAGFAVRVWAAVRRRER